MKAIEFQQLHQGVKSFGDGAGLRTGVGICSAAAPAASVECDDPDSPPLGSLEGCTASCRSYRC
jgi:hypothetical protein